MLPVPARMASAPSPKSGASWNPAVPPPPVAGAAEGTGLADRLGVADGRGVAEWLGVADGLADGRGVADRLADGLSLAPGVVAPVVPGRCVGVAEPLVGGENGVGAAEGAEPVQAETDAEASMVNVAQPATVSLAPSPVLMMVARIFMRPPRDSGRWQTPFRSQYRKRNRGASPDAPGARLPKAGPGRADGHKRKPIDGTNVQWPVHHWNIRLRG